MDKGFFSIKANNFGPLSFIDVEVKPLTIFIGPNNTGKSYTAMLIYSILKANQTFEYLGPYRFLYDFDDINIFDQERNIFRQLELDEITEGPDKTLENKNILDWLNQILIEVNEDKKVEINFSEIPEEIKYSFYKILTRSFPKRLARIVASTFGSKLDDLIRINSTNEYINLDFNASEASYSLKFTKKTTRRTYKDDKYIFNIIENCVIQIAKKNQEDKIKTYTRENKLFIRVKGKIDEKIVLNTILNFLFQKWDIFIDKEMKNIEVAYLPAARSGILQGHKVIEASFYNMAKMAGIKRMEIPALSGVVSDFIVQLILKGKGHGDFGDIAKFIEKEIIKGSIKIIKDKYAYPEIIYTISGSDIPLHRTSSTISELAPLVIYLRDIIKKNSYLIIEEPEAHLHADALRIFARVIAKLIRSGVKIIITTHSDLLLQQLNNHIMMSSLKEEDLINQGYSKDDFIRSSEVSAYLFKFSDNKDGAITEKIEIEKDGVPDDEFATIVNELFNETAILRRKIQ